MLHVGIISILPDMFNSLKYGIVGRAIEQQLARIDCWNPRDWSTNQHKQVDDRPYGGGPGMVMMYEPLHASIQHAKSQMPQDCRVIYLSPQGKQITQQDLNKIAQKQQTILFVAGRYEGIDERLLETDIDEEWSLGDFVLSGGEFAAMVFVDAIIRLLPGSLGHENSAQQDSFMHGILDYPHYTRPANIDGKVVPDVLLNGNHKEIETWRRKQALGKTWSKRPDLIEKLALNDVDLQLLNEYKNRRSTE
jgi:tRNA (guanine37-N1)-methyltransferase